MSDWNDMLNMSAKDLWITQSHEVRLNVLFQTQLPVQLAKYSWDELSAAQQKIIEKYLIS